MDSEPIVLLSNREIEKMRQAGRLAAELLAHLEPLVKPGVSTLALNDEAERWTQAHGAKSAPLGYHGFPKSICTSVNEVVCHGIPNARQILQDGDIINIDVTPILDGFHGDTSRTFCVGNPSSLAKKLVEITETCMMRGIAAVKPGARVGDIGAAIQDYAEAHGFSVVRDFVGHGVGRIFHTAPQIPHYGTRGKGKKLRPGMVFTIEPMINEGTWEVEVLSDNWTAVTKDRKLSAQFEHTIAVTQDGVEILTLHPELVSAGRYGVGSHGG
jgi:methionyl aminopeptidase